MARFVNDRSLTISQDSSCCAFSKLSLMSQANPYSSHNILRFPSLVHLFSAEYMHRGLSLVGFVGVGLLIAGKAAERWYLEDRG